jgi:hypothetical protein
MEKINIGGNINNFLTINFNHIKIGWVKIAVLKRVSLFRGSFHY